MLCLEHKTNPPAGLMAIGKCKNNQCKISCPGESQKEASQLDDQCSCLTSSMSNLLCTCCSQREKRCEHCGQPADTSDPFDQE